ncbi:MAG: type II toxin-antitoxin system RelE/ParE family toxin [Chloroflexi bacterium]|nr:type II toxin-antitoxin system RelE/ParE family toxin [Chloroflexota bacterium]
MTYSVRIFRSAQRQLANIDRQDYSRIIASVRELAVDPRPAGSKKLSGRPAWRIRIGVYRVIYEIHDDQRLIVVVSVGHRRDVYR